MAHRQSGRVSELRLQQPKAWPGWSPGAIEFLVEASGRPHLDAGDDAALDLPVAGCFYVIMSCGIGYH
jgi:hypothetical protein